MELLVKAFFQKEARMFNLGEISEYEYFNFEELINKVIEMNLPLDLEVYLKFYESLNYKKGDLLKLV